MNELIQDLQEKYAESQEIEERFNLVEQQIAELQEFDSNLKALDEPESREMLASLGKGVYISTEIKDKELFVGVGSGVFVKKTPKESRKVVEKQVSGLISLRDELSQRIESLNREMQGLISEIEKKKA